ncbi:MAG: hypothetical protein ACTSWX_04215 [Promethearchaeota archaeon]
MAKIEKTNKIDLGRISINDFNSTCVDKIQMDNKIEEMDKFWDSNGKFGEFNPEEIKIRKDDLYGKIGKLYSDINRLKSALSNCKKDEKEYISALKREIEDNERDLRLFTDITEKCWNLWNPLMTIRNLTWEIRYGELNCDKIDKKEYLKESIKKIKEIQNEIDKEFILDKEEYVYFYTDYLELKEEYDLV